MSITPDEEAVFKSYATARPRGKPTAADDLVPHKAMPTPRPSGPPPVQVVVPETVEVPQVPVQVVVPETVEVPQVHIPPWVSRIPFHGPRPQMPQFIYNEDDDEDDVDEDDDDDNDVGARSSSAPVMPSSAPVEVPPTPVAPRKRERGEKTRGGKHVQQKRRKLAMESGPALQRIAVGTQTDEYVQLLESAFGRPAVRDMLSKASSSRGASSRPSRD